MDLTNSLTISWQGNLCNYIYITKYWGGQSDCVPLCPKVGEDISTHHAETRSLYCGVRTVI